MGFAGKAAAFPTSYYLRVPSTLPTLPRQVDNRCSPPEKGRFTIIPPGELIPSIGMVTRRTAKCQKGRRNEKYGAIEVCRGEVPERARKCARLSPDR